MKKSLIILLFAAVLLGSYRCKPNPDNTIIFLGAESFVASVDSLVPDQWEQAFISKFDIIPTGYFPPNIEGQYRIGEKQFLTSNLGYDLSDSLDMFLRVVNQHNRIASVEFFEGGSVWTDTAFIMGNENWFTLYFTELRELVSYGTTHAHNRFVMFTGRKSEEGIHDLRFGSLILNAENGDDLYVGAFIPGWYFIYKDKDGLSENYEWTGTTEGGNNQ